MTQVALCSFRGSMLELVSVVYCCWKDAWTKASPDTVTSTRCLPVSWCDIIFRIIVQVIIGPSMLLCLSWLSWHTLLHNMWRDQLWVWCCMSYYCYIIKCISPAMNVDKVCTYSSDYWCHKSVRFNGCPLLNSRAIFIDTRYYDSRTIFIDTRYCDSRTIFIDTPYTIVYVGQYFDVVV